MYDLDLCHLGDKCAPGIIIDDILNIRKKCLFMLGKYSFNKILNYLQDDNYEKIYDKKLLEKCDNNIVKHKLYKFTLNHEFKIVDSKFTNYKDVKNRFKEKIKNFRQMLSSESKTVFINVTNDVDKLKLDDMLIWLKEHKKNFHLIIITDKEYSANGESEDHTIIKLENTCKKWWLMKDEEKAILYEEMYNKFIACLEYRNIENNFPKCYEDSEYGKAHPVQR